MTSHIFWPFLTYPPTLSYSITSDFGVYLGPPPLPTLIWASLLVCIISIKIEKLKKWQKKFLDGGSIFFIIFKITQIIEKWALKGFDFDFLTISNFDFGITNESRSILHLVGDDCKTQFQMNTV